MNWEEILFGAMSVIGLCEWAKSFDKDKKFKIITRFFPLVFSIFPAMALSLSKDFSWGSVLTLFLGIFAFSIIGYEGILDLIRKKIDKA